MAALRRVVELLDLTTSYLDTAGCQSARLDAELLLAHVLGMDRLQLYLSLERPLNPDELDRFREVVRARATRRPVAYITGQREFYSSKFAVNANVLIPRPETELVVDQVLECSKRFSRPRIHDVGTGSGAIVLSLANALPQAVLSASDISAAALATAQTNCQALGLSERVQFVVAHMLEGVSSPVDIICSNPPYVPTDELDSLEPELGFEPRVALDGGPDGLAAYRQLLPQAATCLEPGGFLVLEIGASQAQSVTALGQASGFSPHRLVQDYCGLDRVVVFTC